MAKDPSFPFYAQDYLIDTLRWDREMKSLHVDLLAESWVNGPLRDSNHGSTSVQPAFPVGLNSVDQIIWDRIKHKWIFADGFWRNEKLEEVRTARQEYKKLQSERGKRSAELKRKKEKQKEINQPWFNQRSTTVEPVESEIENEIENKLKESLDEIYLENQRMKWPHLDFDFEYRTFCEKVRGSPDHYRGHDTGGIKLAFQAQLRNAKPKSNGQSSKNTERGPDALKRSIADQIMQGPSKR